MCTRLQVHDFMFYILDYVYLTEFVINDIKRFDLIRTQKVVVRERKVAGRDGIGGLARGEACWQQVIFVV